jgi:hypothetical protein
VLEVIVASNYHTQFASEIAATNSFRIIKFDPSTHSKATTPAQSEVAMRSFAIRIIKNILFGRSDASKKHFQRIADEASSKNDRLKEMLTVEYERGIATRNAEIASLEDELHDLRDTTPTIDMISTAERLLTLYPRHPLASHIMNNAHQSHFAAKNANEPHTNPNPNTLNNSMSTSKLTTTSDAAIPTATLSDNEFIIFDSMDEDDDSDKKRSQEAALCVVGQTTAIPNALNK